MQPDEPLGSNSGKPARLLNQTRLLFLLPCPFAPAGRSDFPRPRWLKVYLSNYLPPQLQRPLTPYEWCTKICSFPRISRDLESSRDP